MHKPRFSLWSQSVVLFLLSATTAVAAEKAPRYGALLANGRRLEGAALTDWHLTTPPAAPKLDGQPLLDPSQPLRWLRDRTVVPQAPPAAYVETTTGDRLPGTVTSFEDASRHPFDASGSWFLVQPEVALNPPVSVPEFSVRVLASYVRRIVWQRRAGAALPAGVALFRDGRQQSFRAARFTDEGVNLLTDAGPRRALYGELAEICLPTAQRWDALLDELAVLAPSGAARLLQVETIDGLVATASLDRLRCHPYGAPQDSSRWLHGIQPVWSLDMLWVLNPRIAMRRLWAADEMPLSRLQPTAARHQALIGASNQLARTNRNVLDGPLAAGSQDFGWGFGVQAHSWLEFELPPFASAFRTHVGLDRSAGGGGCVRARVFLDSVDKPPAFDSGFLVGSAVISESGIVPLNAGGTAATKLILEIDPAHEGRPAGADPLDIRDQADWLDPLLMFDAGQLQAELARRARTQLATWSGWHLWTDGTPATVEQRGTLQWVTTWNELAASPGSFQTGVAAVQRPLVLHKSLTVGPRDRWLVLAASQSVATAPPIKLEVRINGDLAAEQPVPLRTAAVREPPPLVVPLDAYREQAIEIEILQHPAPAPAANAPPVVAHWRALGVFEQLPMLYRIFDDEADARFVSADAGGSAQVVTGGAMSGSRSLKVTPPGFVRLELRAPVAIRNLPAWGEYRYVRLAVRKEGEGRFAVQFETAEPRDTPVRIDGGLGPPAAEGAVRIYQAKLPETWIPMPYDLFAQFKKCDLTGISVAAVDGRAAWFDAIYLARELADFERIGRDREPPLPEQAVQDALVAAAHPKAKTALVALERSDGRRAAGALITAAGEVLTTARFAGRPDQPVKIRLADGRLVNGQTRGLARDMDLALVKITDAGPFPFAELDTLAAFAADRPYVIASRQAGDKPGDPRLTTTMIRRVARGMIWIGQPVEKLEAGSPLFDSNGRVVALAIHPHGDRWMFSRTFDVNGLLARLRAGEVVGNWPPSLAPPLEGVAWKAHASGAEADQLAAGSPAAQAGLKPRDVVVRIDGQPVVDPRAIVEILTSKAHGQDIGLELRDGRTVRVRLSP